MIKINLLPTYIAERRRKAVAWIVSAAAWAGIVSLLVVLFLSLTAHKNQLQTQVDEVSAKETAFDSAQQQASSIRGGLGKWLPQPALWESLKTYNKERPVLYQNTTNYIYRNAMALGMESTATQLTLNLYVTDI